MAFSVQLLVGIVGNITSLALFLSPMTTFWGIYKCKSTQVYSGLPYVCTLFNCSLWLLYGTPFVKPNSTLLLTINGAGFALEIIYLMSFLMFAPKREKVKTALLAIAMMVSFVVVVLVTVYALHAHNVRQLLVGILGVILSIAMYASPLSVVGEVIRTKSVEYMPFLVSLFSTLNALVWSGYSVMVKDIFIAASFYLFHVIFGKSCAPLFEFNVFFWLQVPSGIGFLLGMTQLVVYLIYRRSERVSPISTELHKLPEIDKVNKAVDLPIQIVELDSSKIIKVAAVDQV